MARFPYFREIRPEERCPVCQGYTAHPHMNCGRCEIVFLEREIAKAECRIIGHRLDGDADTSERIVEEREKIALWKEKIAAMRGTDDASVENRSAAE